GDPVLAPGLDHRRCPVGADRGRSRRSGRGGGGPHLVPVARTPSAEHRPLHLGDRDGASGQGPRRNASGSARQGPSLARATRGDQGVTPPPFALACHRPEDVPPPAPPTSAEAARSPDPDPMALPAGPRGLCTAGEQVAFSCPVRGKVLSV